MKYLLKNKINNSIFKNDEYLLLSIYFGSINDEKTDSIIEYSKNDDSVIDICFDYDTNEIDYINLIIAKNIKIKETNYELNCNYKEGTICIDNQIRYPLLIESSKFDVTLFNNAILINLSNEVEIDFYKTGDVILSFDKNNNLVNIRFLNFTFDQIKNIKNKINNLLL